MLTSIDRPRSLLSLIPAMLLLALGCQAAPESGTATAPESHLARIKERGKLTILCVPHQESIFARTNLEKGPMRPVGTSEYFEGADIDIMSAFAGHLGVELEVRPAIGEGGIPGYRDLIPALLKGDGDVIASSFSITEERKEKIDFSDPYFTIYPAVLVLADGPIRTLDDLAGKTASTLPGSSQEEHLRAAGFSVENGNLVLKEFQFENTSALLEGEVDFTVQDSTSADRLVAEYPELRIVGPLADVRENYGYGIPKGSDLAGELNSFLAEIKDNGELERILAQYQLTLAD
ncbi:MAG: amino acid ABC transporter substrate-binding protein [Acidobacteria bacterium]|nr:amino acid ABC transporter substrate-binding protein [Acidobacteriota bacterium]